MAERDYWDDEEPDDWYDWYDDMPITVKEEPDCGACNDAGVIWLNRRYRPYRKPRRCPSCDPTRLELWRSRVIGPFGPSWRLRHWWRWRNVPYSDEPPF